MDSMRKQRDYNSPEESNLETESDLDEATEFLQSNMRGYLTNKEKIRHRWDVLKQGAYLFL